MKGSTVIINSLIEKDRKGAFTNFREYKDNLSCVDLENMVQEKNMQFLQSLAQQVEQTEISPLWFDSQSTQNKMKMLKIYQYSILISQNIQRHFDEKCRPLEKEVEARLNKLEGLKKQILQNKDEIKKKKWHHGKIKLQLEKAKLKARQRELEQTKNTLLAQKKALSKTNMLLAQEIQLADNTHAYPVYLHPPNYFPYPYYQPQPQHLQYQQQYPQPQPQNLQYKHQQSNQYPQHHVHPQQNQYNHHQIQQQNTYGNLLNPQNQYQGNSYSNNSNVNSNSNGNANSNSNGNSVRFSNGNTAVASNNQKSNKGEERKNMNSSLGIRASQKALNKNSEFISDSFFNPDADQYSDEVKITDSRLTKKKDSIIGNNSKNMDKNQNNYSPTNRITSQNIKESIKKSKFNPMKISEAASEAFDQVGQLQEYTYIGQKNQQRSQSRKSSGGEELQELSSLMNVKLNTESHNELFSNKGKKVEKKTSILSQDNPKSQEGEELWSSKIGNKKNEGQSLKTPKIKIKQSQPNQLSFLENSKLGSSKNLNKNIPIPNMKIKQPNKNTSRLSDSLDSEILDESYQGKKTPEIQNLSSSTGSDYKDDSLWQSNDGKKVQNFHAGGLKVKMKSPGKNSLIKDEIIQEQQYQHSFEDYEQEEPNSKTRVKVDIGSDSSPEKNMRKFSPLVKNHFILKQSYKNLENSKAVSMEFSDFGELGENSIRFPGTQKKIKATKTQQEDIKMEQIEIPEGSYIARPSANKNSTIHKSSSIQKMSFRQPKNQPIKSVTVSQFSAELQINNKKTLESEKTIKGEDVRDSFKKYDTLQSKISDQNKASAISNKSKQEKKVVVPKFENTGIPTELTESHIINHDTLNSNDESDPLRDSDDKLMRSGQSLLSIIEEDTEESKFTNPEAAKKIKLLIDRKYKQNGAFEFDRNLIKKKIEEVAGDLQDLDWEQTAKKFELMAKKQQNQLRLLNQKIQKKKKASRQVSLASSKNKEQNKAGIKDQISNPIQKSSYAQDYLNYSVSEIQNNSSKGKNTGVKIVDKRTDPKTQKQKQRQRQRQKQREQNKKYLITTSKVKAEELNRELKLIGQKNRFQKDDQVGDLGDLMSLEEKTVKSKKDEKEQDW